MAFLVPLAWSAYCVYNAANDVNDLYHKCFEEDKKWDRSDYLEIGLKVVNVGTTIYGLGNSFDLHSLNASKAKCIDLADRASLNSIFSDNRGWKTVSEMFKNSEIRWIVRAAEVEGKIKKVNTITNTTIRHAKDVTAIIKAAHTLTKVRSPIDENDLDYEPIPSEFEDDEVLQRYKCDLSDSVIRYPVVAKIDGKEVLFERRAIVLYIKTHATYKGVNLKLSDLQEDLEKRKIIENRLIRLSHS